MTRSIHRAAETDLAAAVKFYRLEAGVGVARRFLNEFERVTKVLEASPHLGTPTGGQRRWSPLGGFPFSVIYRVTDRGERILVVRHQSRDPQFGDGRR